MDTNPRDIYQSTLDDYKILKSRIEKKITIIAWSRLLVFIIAIILIYLISKFGSLLSIFILIAGAFIVFFTLVKYHGQIIQRKKMIDAIILINLNELKALEHNYEDLDDGNEFTDPEHHYSSDLDIFGKGSLFQYLNRTSTYIGKLRLAQYLKNPLTIKSDITRNQQSIRELSEKLPWRQNLQAIGVVYSDSKGDKQKIMDWVKEKSMFSNTIYQVLIFIIPILTILAIFLMSFNFVSDKVFILYLIIPWGIAGMNSRKINRRHSMVSKTTEMLEKYSRLIKEIQNVDFESEKLKILRNRLEKYGLNAGKSIAKLAKILGALDHRLGPFSWMLLNGLLLWDILQMIRLEKWQKRNREHVEGWFDVVAEMEALVCFSAFKFNHPDHVFPKVQEGDYIISAEDVGHPLIPNKASVRNEIKIKAEEFVIVTGANMAGKSTYLRTVGINLILAQCGCPVIASSFEFDPIEVYTSIRTQDSLQKSESYFYSELKRLKSIIEMIKAGKRLFVILDEILKGTNSRDKHSGSEALLKQFISLQTSGIVATHDVSLGKLQKIFPKNISNKCFEVDIQGDRLFFDYKLREGVSKNMNATLLMRKMGITV
jgi:ABC-type multidrug transport system fused ATPase/permease subunit